ncbi:zinc finger protein 302 isoform X3 [Chlorocebus sabaeus]|uniref:zinc finger protein 302 isoform X3 n=1 Tax=Chlorocebus sabaeus TaxID=60711 RepID=UPI003BF9DCF7
MTGLPAAHKVRAAAQTLGKCGLPVPAVRGTGDRCPARGGFWEMWFGRGYTRTLPICKIRAWKGDSIGYWKLQNNGPGDI